MKNISQKARWMNDKLSDRSQKQAGEQSLLVTRRINNPRQDSRMLLATQHSANGQVTQ